MILLREPPCAAHRPLTLLGNSPFVLGLSVCLLCKVVAVLSNALAEAQVQQQVCRRRVSFSLAHGRRLSLQVAHPTAERRPASFSLGQVRGLSFAPPSAEKGPAGGGADVQAADSASCKELESAAVLSSAVGPAPSPVPEDSTKAAPPPAPSGCGCVIC